MKRYVAGFLFNDYGTVVTLIHKKKGPPAVVGRWNAAGGKIEEGEDPATAMSREFIEETGVATNWERFMTLSGTGWEVHFFVAYDSDAQSRVRTMEAEEVKSFDVRELPNMVPNLRWIMPMALGYRDDNVSGYTVAEQ